MRPCPSFQLVVTRDTRQVTEIRPRTSRPMAQKLSSRLKYKAIYDLGQNKMRTANPSFFGNQGWSSAKAKTRHFPIFYRGGAGGRILYLPFILSETVVWTLPFMLLLDATVGVLFKKSPLQSKLFGVGTFFFFLMGIQIWRFCLQ